MPTWVHAFCSHMLQCLARQTTPTKNHNRHRHRVLYTNCCSHAHMKPACLQCVSDALLRSVPLAVDDADHWLPGPCLLPQSAQWGHQRACCSGMHDGRTGLGCLQPSRPLLQPSRHWSEVRVLSCRHTTASVAISCNMHVCNWLCPPNSFRVFTTSRPFPLQMSY